MLEVFNNGQALLLKKPHKFWILILNIITIIFLIGLYMFRVKVYDNYQTKGYIICDNGCYIKTAIPSDITFEKIKMNNKVLDYEIDTQEIKLDEENLITYLELTINPKLELNDGEIVNLNFYYNKQRIIWKFKEKIF